MKNIYAYTGKSPAVGYVGYISVNKKESGVEVSVRSEGVHAPTGVITLTPEQCEHLATALLAHFNGETGFGAVEVKAIAKKDAALKACVEALDWFVKNDLDEYGYADAAITKAQEELK